jgi:cell division septal protein FtsQ
MKPFLVIIGTTLLFWVIAVPFLFHQDAIKSEEIQKIGILSTSSESLKLEPIVEWLQLSKDNPSTLDTFDLKEGRERLLKTGLIKEASLYKLPPATLIVCYTLRDPFATVANWNNCVIDEEGVLFPFAPFFTPKELPEIVFPIDSSLEFRPFEGVEFSHFPLAKKIYSKIPRLSRIDLSRLDPNHPRGGEIVLTLEPTLYVRAWLDEWEKRMKDLPLLLPKIQGKRTLDLRVPSRAILN